MIHTHSDDPDVKAAAGRAAGDIEEIVANLPHAESFDYGGHQLQIGEYNVCVICGNSIAQAQQLAKAIDDKAKSTDDETVREHLELAARLMQLEAETAIIRAEFHNGHGTEPILNTLLGYIHERSIHDAYGHSHDGDNAS